MSYLEWIRFIPFGVEESMYNRLGYCSCTHTLYTKKFHQKGTSTFPLYTKYVLYYYVVDFKSRPGYGTWDVECDRPFGPTALQHGSGELRRWRLRS
jgi:hypothetical protein